MQVAVLAVDMPAFAGFLVLRQRVTGEGDATSVVTGNGDVQALALVFL